MLPLRQLPAHLRVNLRSNRKLPELHNTAQTLRDRLLQVPRAQSEIRGASRGGGEKGDRGGGTEEWVEDHRGAEAGAAGIDRA